VSLDGLLSVARKCGVIDSNNFASVNILVHAQEYAKRPKLANRLLQLFILFYFIAHVGPLYYH